MGRIWKRNSGAAAIVARAMIILVALYVFDTMDRFFSAVSSRVRGAWDGER
jgi:hypothetical protein